MKAGGPSSIFMNTGMSFLRNMGYVGPVHSMSILSLSSVARWNFFWGSDGSLALIRKVLAAGEVSYPGWHRLALRRRHLCFSPPSSFGSPTI